jgi:hypothetical protein
VKLPSLRIDGEQASAHTQGLEIVGNKYYVTARRDDVRPRQPILVCFDAASETNLRVWNIALTNDSSRAATLDHPGGLQSDGKRLWIPIAESKPKSRSVIRAFSIASLEADAPKAEIEFTFSDHIGALAVALQRDVLLGANWDTESVYVWDLQGHLKQTLTGSEVGIRGLGISGIGAELAVQDWKIVEQRLFASGLSKTRSPEMASKSQFVVFSDFLESNFKARVANLPLHGGVELGREAMAISEGFAYFLPEDLGSTNRLFRVRLDGILKRGESKSLPISNPRRK